MATIIIGDKTLGYDGRDLEKRPLGGRVSSRSRRSFRVICSKRAS